MEDLREKLPMIIAVIVAILILLGGAYFFENFESIYYTKIDNSKIEKLDATDNMKYEYTLDSYNEKGIKKEMKFKTSRELRECAFLKLQVRVLGVYAWKEVQYEELPDKVKANYLEH